MTPKTEMPNAQSSEATTETPSAQANKITSGAEASGEKTETERPSDTAILKSQSEGLSESSRDSASFDPNRIIVRRWFGHPFEPPSAFRKRFWHKVERITDITTSLEGRERLADSQCTIFYQVEIRYQPTFQYVQKIWDREGHLDNLSDRIFQDYRSSINGVIKRVLRESRWMDIAQNLKATEQRIENEIKGVFAFHEITCLAFCTLKAPHVNWPKDDSGSEIKEPEIIIGQEFYKEVRKNNQTFFLESEKNEEIYRGERENLEIQKRKSEKIREENKRLDEFDKLLSYNNDEIKILEQDKSHRIAKDKLEADERKEKLQITHDEKATRIGLENSLRDCQMSKQKTEEEFLDYEMTILGKEKGRAKLEEELKQTSQIVAYEIEKLAIDVLGEKTKAEHVIEVQKYEHLLKILPQILGKIQSGSQAIENLRVVQFSDNNGDAANMINSPTTQLIQSMAFLRELSRSFDENK